jgi:hypothetical protein
MSNLDNVTVKSSPLIKKIALWILAVIVIFIGLVASITSPVGGIFISTAGILTIPPFFNLLRTKLPLVKVFKIVTVIFVLFLAGLTITFSEQQKAKELDRQKMAIQEVIAEWQTNKAKILAEFDRHLLGNDIAKATEILDKYKNIVSGDKDIQVMSDKIQTTSDKINELAILQKKKTSGPSDIDDLLLPKNWPIWGSDGRKYYRDFKDINKSAASFWPNIGYYDKYQVWWTEDGTINRVYGQPIQFKSHKEIRERMAELCGIDVNQIKYIEGGGFTNAEFSGKYADCTYGFENNSRTVEVTFSRK